MPTALVVGLGSIGERHVRLLGDLGLDVAVVSRRRAEGKPVGACPEFSGTTV